MNKRQQVGYLFHRGRSWFVRYCDDVLEPGGAVKRKQICKKLSVEYGDEYRTKASVRPFAQEILAPINAGKLNPQSTMKIVDFVDCVYLPEHVTKNLRPASLKQYGDIWKNHLKPRMGNSTLRSFRTVDGETMLAHIGMQTKLGRASLRHCKAFLSGAFKTAKRLGILDGINPMADVSIPRVNEPDETHAYTLREVNRMLVVLDEPARTVVLTAALAGLRKGEIAGLQWDDFNGKELTVNRSLWNGIENPPKTRRSRAPVPLVKELVKALENHRDKMGKLAVGPIFQAGNGKPLNLDNLARRSIIPAIETCVQCRQSKSKHKKTDGHTFELDKTLCWYGWHAFRRGLATNLHSLGVDDKTIQAILRHSNIGLTQNVYIKTVAASGISAMDLLGAELRKTTCNDLATKGSPLPN